MEIKKLTVGPLKTNCYIAYHPETNKGVIIDPGGEAKKIIKEAKGLEIASILNTHGHFDHIAANREIKKYFRAKIAIGKTDAPMLTSSAKNYSSVLGFGKIKSPKADLLLKDNQKLKVDGLEIKTISVPGHSPGSVAFLIESHLFTGDILFERGCGLTLNQKNRQKLIQGIYKKIFILSDKTIIHPGHGSETTIGEAKKLRL